MVKKLAVILLSAVLLLTSCVTKPRVIILGYPMTPRPQPMEPMTPRPQNLPSDLECRVDYNMDEYLDPNYKPHIELFRIEY